ncbi:cytosol aminopeptidase [Eurytemora carolleeae]|uniref:cytosol aminopeptidase n=1 Tax=Eurytemora carolleeae TaxID=1294199 RepID=UPI000C788DFB|nr:cytosol aminopeptidase [Eurytemora carolleeae]|eukprot:XP_023344234.1 cytosol aminopeptidase-like [Eurytemora affinis]
MRGCLRGVGESSRLLYTLAAGEQPAVVVGVHHGEADNTFTLTPAGEKLDALASGEISSRLLNSGSLLKGGSWRLVGKVHPDLGQVVAVGLGKPSGVQDEENIDMDRESVRKAAAAGVRAVTDLGLKEVQIENFGDCEAAGEGATLANWAFDRFKAEKKPRPAVTPLDSFTEEWLNGVRLGSAQNFARDLMECPANHLTPTLFVAEVIQQMKGLPVNIEARDQSWAEKMGMGSFLSVSRGSSEPPMFLEMSFLNGVKDADPIVLVGKGVTFDTGGISIKPSAKMDKMRADMGGAATVTATLKAVAEAALPVNLIVLVPLTENMPGGRATKPGDVVTAMNGKTIQVDNTDAEGRLILADALTYADKFNPRCVLDVATLTGAMMVALGTGATGVFSTSSKDFDVLSAAGRKTGDRVWRMPLWQHYTQQMKKSPLADLNNISLTPGGGACTAAAFLKEFTSCKNWMHLDIAGVMENEGAVSYMGSGMSGRPTRTLFQFVKDLQ